MSSTTIIAPSGGSRLKELVVTAAVASVVSALLSPWIRRLMDGPTGGTTTPEPQPPEENPMSPEDYNAQLERLLAVPNPFTKDAATWPAAPTTDRTEHERNDDEDR